MVAGRIPVAECLKAGKRKPVKLYYLDSGKDLDSLVDGASVPAEPCDRATLDELTQGAVHQGVVLIAEPLKAYTIREWLAKPSGSDSLVVVLDGVEDPHNFGAIARSTAALGGAALVFARDRAAPISPASVKAAAGALEYLDLVQETNLTRALEHLKDAGYWTYALDASGSTELWDTELQGNVAMVVGNEGSGIRRLVLERCDFRVRIPISGAISSLNASVAAALGVAEWARQGHSRRTT